MLLNGLLAYILWNISESLKNFFYISRNPFNPLSAR